MLPDDLNDLNNNSLFNYLFGVDVSKVINKINYEHKNDFRYTLQQDSTRYIKYINNIKIQIDNALEQGNKVLFEKLSKKYNMMLLEL